jgi:UDP-MurNAc hydroxylase
MEPPARLDDAIDTSAPPRRHASRQVARRDGSEPLLCFAAAMRTIFFGHACLKLQGDAGSVLIDPWFSREGAFYRSWFQYPENAPLLDDALEGTRAICVSHHHGDHLDPGVLALACARDEALRVHIPRYPTGWLQGRLARVAAPILDRFVEHGPWEPFAAGGASMFFVPEEPPGTLDAAIVARGGGQSVVNLNDSNLSADQLRRIRAELGRVDILALQCSGASEFPVCYDYPAGTRLALARRKRADRLALCRETIELLGPERVLFFAGPPAFLDPELAALDLPGDASVFPDQLDVLRHFEAAHPDIARRAYLVVPGEALADDLLFERADLSQARLEPYTRKAEHLRAYAARRADLPVLDLGTAPGPAELADYFSRMATLSSYMSGRIGGPVTFVAREASGREVAYTVDFAAGCARPGRDDGALYVLTTPAACLHDLIAGRATWDDVFLSLRMRFEERTDRFILHLKTLLRYMDPAVFSALEAYELAAPAGVDDTFELDTPRGRYRVQRRCPHAGTDLESHGSVDSEGGLTCLAHRFCFDLDSGECRNVRGYRLRTERVAD